MFANRLPPPKSGVLPAESRRKSLKDQIPAKVVSSSGSDDGVVSDILNNENTGSS